MVYTKGRLDGLEFKFGIFTNFSQDHLDYHKSMKNYFKAKMLLFSKIRKKKGFIICDNKINNFSKLQKEAKKNNLKILTIKKIINKGFIKKGLLEYLRRIPKEKFINGYFSCIFLWSKKNLFRKII